MVDRNHSFPFRPLIGGVFILNPANGRPGTLGLIAIRNDGSRFLVSAYHVLCRPEGGTFVDGETVEQPIGPGNVVAHVFAADTDPALDVAAARIAPAVGSEGRVLGLPPLTAAKSPEVGMEVLKSGAATGVSEGRLTDVDGTRVLISRPVASISKYEVSGFGDSGALWVERETLAPICMHLATDDAGRAVALDIQVAFLRLDLHVLQEA